MADRARSVVGHGRRWQLAVLTLVTLAAVAASLAVLNSVGRATSGGDPYAVPDVVDTNPDPNVVETSITAQLATVDIGNGVKANAETYNGTIPGPTFHLKVGDTVIVHFKNDMPTETGIHWHGIELPNSMDGTPFTQNQVQPGGTFLYKFKVNRPGLFWYHPHHHSSTNQVFKGLYGMIVVQDPNDAPLTAAGVLPPASATKQIVLSDTTVCKASGTNDTATYAPGLPWVGGGALPAQPAPFPKTLCEAPTALDESGNPRPAYAAGDIPAIQQNTGGRTNEGQTVLTNGKNVGARAGAPVGQVGAPPGALAPDASTLDVKAGQGLRLQILNAATIRYMRLRLTDNAGNLVPLVRVGGEGGLLNNATIEGGLQGLFDTGYTTGETLIPPGSRADVVAAIPPAATGVLTLWTEDYQRIGQGPNWPDIPTVPVMHLKVAGTAASTYTLANNAPLRAAEGDPIPVLGPPTGTLLNPAAFAPPKPGSALQNIQLQAGGASAKVDGVIGAHEAPAGVDYTALPHQGSARYAKEGDILQLTVQNTTGAHHPFHMHGFSIQPIKIVSGANTFTFPTEFRDNVDVPANSTLTFRVKLDPRNLPDGVTPGGAQGRWVFHCHIFFHAETGMIAEVVVTSPTGKERPNVNVDAASTTAKQGATASATGTFQDPNGEAVALSSSVGTVTKSGAGTWSWSFPTGSAPSQVVYVTATNASGLKSQIPFQLNVTNTPPILNLPGPKTVAYGDPLGFKVSATDADATDKIALTATGLPKSLKLKDNGNRTGTVSGTVVAAAKAYTATFAANDGRNPPVTRTIKITVTPLGIAAGTRIRLVRRAITTGCRVDKGSLKSCSISVFRGSRRVGRGSVTLRRTGKRTVALRIALDATTRRFVAGSLGGVTVQLRATAKRFGSGKTLTVRKTTKVVAPSVTARPKFASFAAGGTKLNARATAFLGSVARTVGSAKRIVCTGHPDAGLSRSKATSQARSRAAAACTRLRRAGLKSAFRAAAALRPAGQRIEITIQR